LDFNESTILPYENLKIIELETVDNTFEECQPSEAGVVVAKGHNIFAGHLDKFQNQRTQTK
jgi:hypothetical protein